jgi:murein DD-endopeptidase MepM/ murein hydrolase activator NlpD
MNGIPLTRYQVSRITYYMKYALIFFVVVFLSGNIIKAVIKKRVLVSPAAYELKDGFPLFTNAGEYLKLVREYPHDFGVQVKMHRVQGSESLWMIAHNYRVSVDTIVAANPFLKSLDAREGDELVVPLEEGVLLPVDQVTDAWRMSKRLGHDGPIRGDYKHGIFDLFSLDQMRFAFYRNCRPILVNAQMESLYEIKRQFQAPVLGYFTSMFGMRHDSHFGGMAFHNGIDIAGRVGDRIRPVRGGIVSFEGWQDGYGKTIIIQHEDGYVSMYGHLNRIFVKKGDLVGKKDIIGHLGTTGRSTGPHLHFVMKRHNEFINPLLFIW